MNGVIGRRAFDGLVDVALFIPLSISCNRGRAPSSEPGGAPCINWKWRTADR